MRVSAQQSGGGDLRASGVSLEMKDVAAKQINWHNNSTLSIRKLQDCDKASKTVSVVRLVFTGGCAAAAVRVLSIPHLRAPAEGRWSRE